MKAIKRMPPERLAHLIRMAREVFEEEGVGHATIDQIANRAGISKATIYREFSNKEDLFRAVILHVSDELSGQLGRFALDLEDPASSLLLAARTIRSAHLETLEIVRLIIAEMPRHHDICVRARDSLGQSLFERLYEYFELLRERQQMAYEDTDSATRLFSMIAMGGFRPLTDALASPKEEEMRIYRELQIFIRGCGIESSPTPPVDENTRRQVGV